MKKCPNSLDWLIYKLFQKWWNPIFKQNKPLGLAFIKYMETWYKNHGNNNDNSNNTTK